MRFAQEEPAQVVLNRNLTPKASGIKSKKSKRLLRVMAGIDRLKIDYGGVRVDG